MINDKLNENDFVYLHLLRMQKCDMDYKTQSFCDSIRLNLEGDYITPKNLNDTIEEHENYIRWLRFKSEELLPNLKYFHEIVCLEYVNHPFVDKDTTEIIHKLYMFSNVLIALRTNFVTIESTNAIISEYNSLLRMVRDYKNTDNNKIIQSGYYKELICYHVM